MYKEGCNENYLVLVILMKNLKTKICTCKLYTILNSLLQHEHENKIYSNWTKQIMMKEIMLWIIYVCVCFGN